MNKDDMPHFFTKAEIAVTVLAVILAVAGAFFFLPPLHQRDYAPVGNIDVAAETGPIDINHATAEKLALLPGIGETKSEAILEYIRQNGPFKTLEDVAKVKGISAKTVESWQGIAVVH